MPPELAVRVYLRKTEYKDYKIKIYAYTQSMQRGTGSTRPKNDKNA